jgi:hypothetical protein
VQLDHGSSKLVTGRWLAAGIRQWQPEDRNRCIVAHWHPVGSFRLKARAVIDRQARATFSDNGLVANPSFALPVLKRPEARPKSRAVARDR